MIGYKLSNQTSLILKEKIIDSKDSYFLITGQEAAQDYILDDKAFMQQVKDDIPHFCQTVALILSLQPSGSDAFLQVIKQAGITSPFLIDIANEQALIEQKILTYQALYRLAQEHVLPSDYLDTLQQQLYKLYDIGFSDKGVWFKNRLLTQHLVQECYQKESTNSTTNVIPNRQKDKQKEQYLQKVNQLKGFITQLIDIAHNDPDP